MLSENNGHKRYFRQQKNLLINEVNRKKIMRQSNKHKHRKTKREKNQNQITPLETFKFRVSKNLPSLISRSVGNLKEREGLAQRIEVEDVREI